MKSLFLFPLMFILMLGNIQAQKYGDTPEDSAECVMHLSLYVEDYKLWETGTGNDETFVVMVDSWRWVFKNCPAASENAYIHGLKIMKHFMENAADEAGKEAYIDTIMIIYDQRLKYYPEKAGDIKSRMGVELLKLRPQEFEKANQILKEAIDIEGNGTSPGTAYYYLVSAINMTRANKKDTAYIIETYDLISEIYDYNIENNPAKKSSYEGVLSTVEQVAAPYLNCNAIKSIYGKKMENDPENIQLLKKITALLFRKDCKDSELFFKASEKLHSLQPTANTAYLMATMNFQKENMEKTIEYSSEAVDLFEDNDSKIKSLILLAEAQKNVGQYSSARSNAYEVLSLDDQQGKAYLLLGDIYVKGAKTCGDNELTQKAPYWAAVDKYYKAKSVDPSLEEICNIKIGSAKNYFPAKSTIFFYNLNEGASYKVGCWISETTTIRSSD